METLTWWRTYRYVRSWLTSKQGTHDLLVGPGNKRQRTFFSHIRVPSLLFCVKNNMMIKPTKKPSSHRTKQEDWLDMGTGVPVIVHGL
jgi:hypothetical protein